MGGFESAVVVALEGFFDDVVVWGGEVLLERLCRPVSF